MVRKMATCSCLSVRPPEHNDHFAKGDSMSTEATSGAAAEQPRRRTDELLATLADRIGTRFSAASVYGTPIERDGVTVVPRSSERDAPSDLRALTCGGLDCQVRPIAARRSRMFVSPAPELRADSRVAADAVVDDLEAQLARLLKQPHGRVRSRTGVLADVLKPFEAAEVDGRASPSRRRRRSRSGPATRCSCLSIRCRSTRRLRSSSWSPPFALSVSHASGQVVSERGRERVTERQLHQRRMIVTLSSSRAA